VIDKSGTRHTVRGLEGSSLAVALKEYGQFEDTSFLPNPWDTSFPDCHVYVQSDFLAKLPKLNSEQLQAQSRLIDDYVRAQVSRQPGSRSCLGAWGRQVGRGGRARGARAAAGVLPQPLRACSGPPGARRPRRRHQAARLLPPRPAGA
jgi:hypothetical protein